MYIVMKKVEGSLLSILIFTLVIELIRSEEFLSSKFASDSCELHSSCTECLKSVANCTWHIKEHRCLMESIKQGDDIVVSKSKVLQTPDIDDDPNFLPFCPQINGIDGENEILVAHGEVKGVQVKVQTSEKFFDRNSYVCQFNIDGQVTNVSAKLMQHMIYCDLIKFTYMSYLPSKLVTFNVLWNSSKPFDNPDNIHVVIYTCEGLVRSSFDWVKKCSSCLTLPEKYNCGWCPSTKSCTIIDQCPKSDKKDGVWRDRSQICPSLEYDTFVFTPLTAAYDGRTRVKIIEIITLVHGKLYDNFTEIKSVTVAGVNCRPLEYLYVNNGELICELDTFDHSKSDEGKVIIELNKFRVESKKNFKFVNPSIDDFSPKFGPQSGGTKITITGKHLDAGISIKAFIDEKECDIISIREDIVVCRTAEVERKSFGQLRMEFDRSIRKYEAKPFEFRDNPTIISVSSDRNGKIPPKGIPAGGIKIYVNGTNFEVIEKPKMDVYYGGKQFNSSCTTIYNELMECDSPVISAENDELDANYPEKLHFGFIMDNVHKLQMVDFWFDEIKKFELCPNPSFNEFENGFETYTGGYITITGENLDCAIKVEDVKVTIGHIICDVISISQQNLTCQPQIDDLFSNEYQIVMVKVGQMSEFRVGVLSFPMVAYKRIFIIGTLPVLLILLTSTAYFSIKARRKSKKIRKLASAFHILENSNLENIDPQLSLNEQANLLKYDKQFEFPADRLCLGGHLGSGVFGIVRKGIAKGILPLEKETTVAVKMIKSASNYAVTIALISELKIMSHLGKHLNVVNLLGAVTKNVAKRDLMVIVEFCQYGNLRDFLRNYRECFIDQIDLETGTIDSTKWTQNPTYLNEDDSSVYSVEIDESPKTEYVEVSNMINQSKSYPPLRPITTIDLLCWSFQIARGMRYLSSRKVLHNDLAARNVLFCDNNVVKIGDFGLARSLSTKDEYHKEGEEPIPYKWLALESLKQYKFNTNSDVWSFGIVIWELFSLGNPPYPDINNPQTLITELEQGIRLSKPDYATNDIYDIMLSCWNRKPNLRPTFDDLEKSFSNYLDPSITQNYIDLNKPFEEANENYFSGGRIDFIALMNQHDLPEPNLIDEKTNHQQFESSDPRE